MSLTANLSALERCNPHLSARLGLVEPAPASLLQSQCSRVDPLAEAKAIADTVDTRYNAMFIVLGFGAGHHVAAIAGKLGPNGLIVVLEPDAALLKAALDAREFPEFRESNIVIMDGSERDGDFANIYKGGEGLLAVGVQVVSHPPSYERVAPVQDEWLASLERCCEAVKVAFLTCKAHSNLDMEHRLKNAPFYVANRGIGLLKDLHKGSRGVVVSAGPSLAKAIPHLRDDGEVLIVAVQTALKPLLAAGIRPHYVCAIDYSDISLRFYEGLKATDVLHVPLVVDAKVHPSVPLAWPGLVIVNNDAGLNKMLGDDLCGHRKFDGEYSGLAAGGTVAHMAYYLARWLGCDPVALVGQDLGFTDGCYYGSGAVIHDTWAPELNEFCTLEMLEWERVKRMGYNLAAAKTAEGEPIYTDTQMNNYRVQFEREWTTDAAAGLTTVDCSGGVAKAGTVPGTIEEFVK